MHIALAGPRTLFVPLLQRYSNSLIDPLQDTTYIWTLGRAVGGQIRHIPQLIEAAVRLRDVEMGVQMDEEVAEVAGGFADAKDAWLNDSNVTIRREAIVD